MDWSQLGLIGFGAILGLLSTLLFEHIRRGWDRQDRRERSNKLLSTVVIEIEEGVKRCQGYVHGASKGRYSFSHVYTGFWDSVRVELASRVEDTEILKLLHFIYYRFDLVNFNMEREAWPAGAGFAIDYLEEMQENLSKLRARIQAQVAERPPDLAKD